MSDISAPLPQSQKFRCVIMGPPGSGKGSQSPPLVEHFGVCHLSTGDMLRDAIKQGTPNGHKAKSVMDQGQLVSNDIVFDIVKDAMKKPECERGWVLDGLPRTLEQAKMMDKLGFGVQRVVAFDVPDDVIVKRITGRLLHQPSGRTYHTMFHPPKVEGKDDVTGEPLTQRADDNETVIVKRLETFHEKTKPIYQYYRDQKILEVIDGNRPMNMVKAAVLKYMCKYFEPIKAIPF